jgi:hypothetical protein
MGDYLDILMFTLKTDRGWIDIELRNSHNGYYGGTIEYRGEIDHSEFDSRKDQEDILNGE